MRNGAIESTPLLKSLQEPLGCPNPFVLPEFVAFELYTDVAAKARLVQNDLHHSAIVDLGLIPLSVKLVRLGTDAFGEWHQLSNSFVAVHAAIEVPEIGERPEVCKIDRFHQALLIHD